MGSFIGRYVPVPALQTAVHRKQSRTGTEQTQQDLKGPVVSLLAWKQKGKRLHAGLA